MKSTTKEFLDLVRDAEDPSVADERRVRAAVRSAIALGAVSVNAASVNSSLSGAGGQLGLGAAAAPANGLAVLLGSKLFVVAVVAAASLGAGDSSSRGVGQRRMGQPAVQPPSAVTESAKVEHAPPNAVPEVVEPPAESEEVLRAPAPAALPAPAPRSAPQPTTHRASAEVLNLPSSLSEELALLKRVQSALRQGDGAQALRLLDRHKTADQQLAAERDAARILALCASGLVLEAQHAARTFSRRHAGSVHARAIKNSCANSKRIRTR